MNYMRLLKLLYIADRESLRDGGHSITGSAVVAMERGPVLEDVYDLIRGQDLHADEWAQFFHREDYHLVMHKDPGLSTMTRFITSKIEEVATRYRDCDEWAMVDITHKLPEWAANNPGDSCKPIPLDDILRAIGREDERDRIVENDSKSVGAL